MQLHCQLVRAQAPGPAPTSVKAGGAVFEMGLIGRADWQRSDSLCQRMCQAKRQESCQLRLSFDSFGEVVAFQVLEVVGSGGRDQTYHRPVFVR